MCGKDADRDLLITVMFFFERDVSGRLIAAARKHLPDYSGVPTSLKRLQPTQFCLRSLILAIVRRGDFDVAVRKLVDLLLEIARDHRYEFVLTQNTPRKKLLAADSILVVLEALIMAFTQHMIDMGILEHDARNPGEPRFQSLQSVYCWSAVTRVPPLEKSVASDLLMFMTRVMPTDVADLPLATSLEQTLKGQLADVLLSVSQYIYMSNPLLVHEAMSAALAEWDPPARIDVLLLSPTETESFVRYLRLSRSILPRLDSNDQHSLMKLVFVSMMRGILAKPSCCWATGPAAFNAIQGFTNAVEKSRPFRAFRVFRTNEASVITIMEVLKSTAKRFLEAHQSTPVSSAVSSPVSLNAASSNWPPSSKTSPVIGSTLVNTEGELQHSQHLHHHNEAPPQPHPSVDSDAAHAPPSPHVAHVAHTSHAPHSPLITHTSHAHSHLHSHSHGLSHHQYLSVAHLKIFERAISLIKRDNPADKRVASRLAAIEYLVHVGFHGWVVSERPDGELHRGLAYDLLPYTPYIVEEFENIDEHYRAIFTIYCFMFAPNEFERLLPVVDTNCALLVLKTMHTSSSPENFVRILKKLKTKFCKYVFDALKKNNIDAVLFPLNLLIRIPKILLPLQILHELLPTLTNYISANYDMDQQSRDTLESVIAMLVKYAGVDQFLHALTVMLPKESAIELLLKPAKLKALHQLLRLLSDNRNIVPIKYLEKDGFLAQDVHKLRQSLMLSLCSDSSGAIDTALKCLELLQSDPHQSSAERDLVSELLDVMDQSLPSKGAMQKRMAASLAADSDPSFVPLNESIREALTISREKPISAKLHCNLLRMRTATLALEQPAVRASFYMDYVNLDGALLQAVSGSIPLETSLAEEFFRAITRMNEGSLARIGPINGSQLNGKCQLYTWLLLCLKADHLCSSSELRLGEISARAVASLTPHSTSTNEIMVLTLVAESASYAAGDELPEATSISFSQVVDKILNRSWYPDSESHVGEALAAIFEHYKEPDAEKLTQLLNQILNMNLKSIRIPVLTALLNKNMEHLMLVNNGISHFSDVYRASTYEALTKRYQSKTTQTAQTFESEDFVMFLLENEDVLNALSDVCSVNGDAGLASALVQLFGSHSHAAERRLIEITVKHEVNTSTAAAELFRSNSVTMKILLEWLRSVSSTYLNGVLAPALGSLRSASIRDDADMESLFADATKRFKSRSLPTQLQWLICLVKETVAPRYGDEVAIRSVSVLMVLRFICPAVVAPHRFGITRRPPARHFASTLRKFAIYLQRRGEHLCEIMVYIDTSKNGGKAGNAAVAAAAAGSNNGQSLNSSSAVGSATNGTASAGKVAALGGHAGTQCCCADQYEALIAAKEAKWDISKVEFEEQYTSATRQVYHFLRRHSAEVRVVLLSHGNGEVVAKMLRYFRIGRNSTYMDGASEDREKLQPRSMICGAMVVPIRARDLCFTDGMSRGTVHLFGPHPEPTAVDFTDFSGLFDRWAEFMLYVAYSSHHDGTNGYSLYAINCPRRTKSVTLRVKELVSLPIQTKFFTSLDFKNTADIPPNLPDLTSAVTDLIAAVKFHVQVKSPPTMTMYEADLYIGARYMQIICDDTCDVLPYVTPALTKENFTARLVRKELLITSCGTEFTIFSPSTSLLRVLALSLTAADAEKLGATIDIGPELERLSVNDSSAIAPPITAGVFDTLNAYPSQDNLTPLTCDGGFDCFTLPDEAAAAVRTRSSKDIPPHMIIHDMAVHKEGGTGGADAEAAAMAAPAGATTAEKNKMGANHPAICPGRLLFSALYDAMHESDSVRRRALELLAVLPDSLGLRLNVPGPQQILMPNQVFSLAASAAKRHPELAMCVASGLASMGSNITERAVQIVAPWVPYVVVQTAENRTTLREKVLRPLLQEVAKSPDVIGPVLLEYFWPHLKDLPTLIADLLLETSIAASTEGLNALRQIVSSGIPSDRPHEAREFAEALLASLYSSLRGSGDPSATLWSQHTEWHEINVSAILFASVSVDWQTAEVIYPEVSFILLILAGVGTAQLRMALHNMLINYVNVFLQSPNSTPAQRLRLEASRAELTGPRGKVLFGVQNDDPTGSDLSWVSDIYTDYTPEMTEHLGRLLSDISITVFANRLSGYQEARVAVATRVMEFVDTVWPPLQRRCVLALIAAVRFLMPESVVNDLVKNLGRILDETSEGALETRGVLVSSYLRMFGETIECIPDAGAHHQYLFWLAVVALATGCVEIQADAVRLLRESIKLAHFRGSFRERTVASTYMSSAPKWMDSETGEPLDHHKMLPLDIPTTEENFHLALAQLLVLPLQQPESQTFALECCDVLATACPGQFVYVALLYLGGEESRIATRVPTGVFLDSDEGVPQWLASRVKQDNPSSVLALALCAEITGFSRSMDFSQTGPRLLDLIMALKDRAIVNMISPLLRPTFLRLIKLDERETEIGLNRWSSGIFSFSPEERAQIAASRESLHDLVNRMEIRPWFDDTYKMHPLFYEDKFTGTTRHVLKHYKWQPSPDPVKISAPSSAEIPGPHTLETEKLF